MQPLSSSEREYRQSLLRIERRAVIPLKWLVLVVTLFLWFLIIGGLPAPAIFYLFLGYFLVTLADTYFFMLSRLTDRQILWAAHASYLADVAFVALLVYLDLGTGHMGATGHHDFYLLYFLVIMRGFALFRRVSTTLVVNLVISFLYVLTFTLQRFHFTIFFRTQYAVSLMLIWLVILVSWLLVAAITRQKMELLAVHEQWMRTENLARLGQMAASVAHEINNPIGVIATTADYLKQISEPEDPRREELESIQSEAMRCKQIVQQMLTYANPRPTGRVPVDLVALVEEVEGFVFPAGVREGFELRREDAAAAALVWADPNLLKQALLNLYINARQAIPEGRRGRIVTRLRPHEHGRRVRLEIEDNGVGIEPGDLESIFDPFFTRKEAGTGLGLAVTQRLVETLGGAISVRSTPGKGSTFTIDLSAAEET